ERQNVEKAEEQRRLVEERRKKAEVRKELYKKETENEKDLSTSFSHSIGQKCDEILVIENTSQKENIFYNDINLVNSAGNTSNELQQRNNRTDKGFKLNRVKNVARKLICGYGILFFTMGIIAYFAMFVQSVIEGEFILSISALMLALDFIILDKIMFVQFKHEETVSHKNETMSRKKYTKTMLKTVLKLTGFFIVIAVAGGLIL
ncbi:MAG: hypothetical protein J6J05_02205, partial [Peptococcaceae bacterium]|nr:hypothetical protein [Peptococcaceae bacterium]